MTENDDVPVTNDESNSVERYTPIYPVLSDVDAMIKLVDDSLTNDLIDSCMANADNAITGLLSAHLIPTYTNESEDIPKALITAGNFFTVCYIHKALQGTDDIATNAKEYCDMAKELIDAYIKNKKDSMDDEALKESMNPYASSKSPSVYELGIRKR